MTRWQKDDDRSGDPQPGYYEMKLVKRGFTVACRIIHDEEGWTAIIDGKASAPQPDPAHSPSVMRVWHSAQHSTEAGYAYLADLKAWAKKHQPNHPSLHPLQPVNVAALAPVIP